MGAPPNVVLLPPPTFLGHLIPFIELAKKLVLQHKCTVTIIVPDDGSSTAAQKPLLQGLPHGITSIFLPQVPIDDVPEDINVLMLLTLRIVRSLPSLADSLASLKELGTPAAALVMDLFAPHASDIAKEFGIPAYIYYVVAATDLSISSNQPMLEALYASKYRNFPRPIMLPGSILLNPEDMTEYLKERNSEVDEWSVDLCKRYHSVDGILVNSFTELESQAFEEIRGRQRAMPPVYPVGPLIRAEIGSQPDRGSECLRWLNDQPPKSVIYVSFGSGGTLTLEQFKELAWGLEMSAQRFLWVVRCPQENAEAAYLGTAQAIGKNPLNYLPQGFLERTKEKGLVVASWVPQIQVLSHYAVGGFVTHCGWNSILESAVHGVPMIAWPLCFEQKMNAVFVTEGLKGALRVKEKPNGVVEKEHFSDTVTRLMHGEEGKRIRNTMIDVKIAAKNALSQGGSSTMALAKVVHNLTVPK